MGSRFKVGDKVRKITGYPFTGTVCAVYQEEEKCIVKHKDKWEHIFSDKQLDYDHPEYQYLDLLSDVLENGVYREGRNGGTYGVFGRQIRFDLNRGFPLLTTKKVHWKSVAVELFWFLRGDTNIKYLHDNGVTIWSEWADNSRGWLGPVYGKQWRRIEKISWVTPKIFQIPDIELNNNKVAGVGTGGEFRSIDEKLYSIWNGMLHRCYDTKKESEVKYYKNNNIFVDERWHHFPNFVDDVKKLEGWELKKAFWEDYSLDKDFYMSNKYGPETCKWACKTSQNINTSRASNGIIQITRPDGVVFITMNAKEFARDYGLDFSHVYKCIESGKLYDGFKFERIYHSDSNYYPRVTYIDQIKNVIASLKNDPNSRRHIISSWNPDELGQMALPPCHCLFQFFVENGRLSCQLYQRSADIFLGVPFNIASYALLTHLIAREADLEVGEFVHTFGDLHLYENHVEQAKLQMERTPLSMPQIDIATDKGIFELEFKDINLIDYNSHPAIKAEVSK